ncbi:hypothetical protein DM02DRAFT_731630 [Periconia macrospinosa]|uniref:Zn(2)-C6 fungal-type domain-containing protein n=1 Tax=Periconia macrospinosa TaxID=97972 RepID=A0A2V1DF83_9PLEO|nr:hypothetical protein DM02DRAFT_731630 [Periconia macrospinosa]
MSTVPSPQKQHFEDRANPSRPRPNRAACATCHRRKIKCDAQTVGFPCSNCRKHSRFDCVLHEKKRRLPVRSPHNPVPIRRAPSPSAQNDQASSSPNLLQEHQNGSPSDLPSQSTRDEEMATSTTDGEGLSRSDESALGCKRHLVEFIDQEDLTYRPIDKAARLTYVAYEPDRIPVEAFQLPEKSIVDALLQAYFEKINPGFPVVEEERFMAQYTARDPANPPSLLLLHAILVVGAHVSPDHTDLKPIFFRRAKILIDSRFEANRDVIVQAALLLTWHSDGPEDVAANAWYWIGFASRTAMGLGMHRDAEPSTLVDYNKRMWRRVWWLLVQCDFLVSLQYGRPLSINLEDCDVQPPQASDYVGCGPDTQIDLAITSTELCVIGRTIYRKAFGPLSSRFRRQDVLEEADKKLAAWSLLLPPHLRLRPTLTLDLWPATLHLMYNTILILLHRPRPQPLHPPPSPSLLPTSTDADICSAAAGVVQSIFESLRDRNQLSSLWVFSVTTIFTVMIQLSVEVRCANPLLALAALRKYDSTLYSLKGLSRFWPNAESVLHFFENSEKIQKARVHVDGELADRERSRSWSSRVEAQAEERGELLSESSNRNEITGGTSAENIHHVEAVNTAIDSAPEPSGLRQLFPFTEALEDGEVMNNAYLDYWTEMYWQEPLNFGDQMSM